MLSTLRMFLLTGVLLAAIPAWGEAPPPGPENLPTLDSIPQVTVSTERTVSVTCYLGNPNNRQTLGSISASAQSAGSSCNSLYYDCQGRCFGCYSDFDLSEDICVDNSGRKFLR